MKSLSEAFAAQLEHGTTLMYIVCSDAPPDDGGSELATVAEICKVEAANIETLSDLVFVDMSDNIPVFKTQGTTTV